MESYSPRGKSAGQTQAAPRLVTVEEAARLLRISRTGTYGLLRSGELASVKIGGRRRVSVAAIDQYIGQLHRESQERRAAASA
jgi:excisionase family DNA binding protein